MNKILVINAGSSSIKWTLFNKNLHIEAKGVAERIKMDMGKLTLNYQESKIEKDIFLPSFLETVKQLVELWEEHGIIHDYSDISKVAFRVVNGGPKLQSTTYVNEQTIDWLKESIDLAPVHNPGALEAIIAFKELFTNATMSMHFDTSFHNTLPKVSYTYPINSDLAKELNIRKYGFHGLNYHYITEKCQELFNKQKINVVIMHIGNGASLCAVEDSKSIDTSMGFTPLAGIMMGTRSGDIDASIIPYIIKHKGFTVDEIFKILNEKSGMLGVSNVSSDVRDVQKAKKENLRAAFALDLYTQRIADYLITYINKIKNKLDAIVFTAGVGENDHLVREQVIKKINLINLKVDESKNKGRDFGDYKIISSDDSVIPIYVIRAEEEMFIAKEAITMKQN
ncbi:acetate/propionate family kinase [Metamycoplasma phocicerebrale]|uniref:Acetate kinase n=1 Tax=Metamycoplasma phocicerebrale TaxID=142649 RepID=A0A3Q9V2P5_9BACT|nr:acetate/propionate family kinase [Metamycoplasma phocicerebrale]AZZ65242.1 acetate/propionate family kinase [Metamycoplasma phocicerebrale]